MRVESRIFAAYLPRKDAHGPPNLYPFIASVLGMQRHLKLVRCWPYTERRRHPRKPCFIAVDFTIKDRAFRDFIRNISAAGVFIEVMTPLLNEAETTVVFSLPNHAEPFKVAGHIAWTSLRGLGVQFDTTSAYLEAMTRLL
jgi:Tfp pilus assembly protein PilZ